MALELDLRGVADDRARRYVADGSWTDETLGSILAAGLTDAPDTTLAVYSQYPYATEKRAALDLWADRLSAVVGGSGAKVALLSRKAAR